MLGARPTSPGTISIKTANAPAVSNALARSIKRCASLPGPVRDSPPTDAHRRVRALEESGVLLGYRAQLDPGALGLNFSAMVFATLREGDRQAVEAFETALIDIPQVVDAQRLFGEPDYLMHVIAQDLPAFQRLYDETFRLPNVQRLTSTLVMKRVIQDRPLPL